MANEPVPSFSIVLSKELRLELRRELTRLSHEFENSLSHTRRYAIAKRASAIADILGSKIGGIIRLIQTRNRPGSTK